MLETLWEDEERVSGVTVQGETFAGLELWGLEFTDVTFSRCRFAD